MADEVFTLGAWRVKAGMQEEFIEAWKAVGDHFGGLAQPPGRGTLLQSLEDEQVFYSFGPWPSLEAIQAMRDHPGTPAAIGRLLDLCEEGTPGAYRVAASA